MAFNFGSFGGGLISGAGAGSAFGPIGAGIGAALGGISSLFGGGGSGGTQFLPSEMMQRYMDIGLADIKPPKWKKKLDLQDAKRNLWAGDRGAYEDVLRGLTELYPTEKFYGKALKRSLKKDVNLASSNKAFDVADQIYKNAGLTFTGQEFQDMAGRAERGGARGSAAFGDFLKQNLAAQGKILTPQQEQLTYIFGGRAFPRTSEGYYMTYGSSAQ